MNKQEQFGNPNETEQKNLYTDEPSQADLSYMTNHDEDYETVGLSHRSKYEEEITIDLNTTANNEEIKKEEEEARSKIQKISDMKLEITNQIQCLWLTNLCFAVSLFPYFGVLSFSTIHIFLRCFYGFNSIAQVILMIVQPKNKHKIHQRASYLLKYIAGFCLLMQMKSLEITDYKPGITWICLFVLYCLGSLNACLSHLIGCRIFMEALTYKIVHLCLEGFKSLLVILALSKYANFLSLSWPTALLPAWPIFYIYFGVAILLSCNFFIKITSLCCSKFEKAQFISISCGFSYLVLNSVSFFLVLSMSLSLAPPEDDNPDSPTIQTENRDMGFAYAALITSVLGTAILFFSRKQISGNLLIVMKLTLNDVLSEKKTKDKKVKVNYPLFVKKSKANMFQRAGKEDFKRRKKKKIPQQSNKLEAISIEEAQNNKVEIDSLNNPGKRLYSSMMLNDVDYDPAIKITARERNPNEDEEFVLKTVRHNQPKTVRARVSYCLTNRHKYKPPRGITKEQLQEEQERKKAVEEKEKQKEPITEINVLENINDDDLCFICFSNQSNCLFLNCGHGGICLDCAMDTIKKNNICTLCREVVVQIIEIDPTVEIRKGLYKVINSYYVSREEPGASEQREGIPAES